MKKVFLFIASYLTFIVYSQTLVTTSGLTATQYVNDVLLGSGVTASGITYTGDPDAIGKFVVTGAGLNQLGLDSGLVLTTGTVLNTGTGPQGPNASGSNGEDNAAPGDADLNIVGGSTGSFNAAILEFDFIPTSDTIKFDFVFGSEEYMEFVDAGVSDAFGFFLSGPGFAGPFSSAAENIALIPGTTTGISIDNLNLFDFPAFYVNNEPGITTLLQYDGHTTVLTAIAAVQCNQQYHIKIAIGDQGDGVWDSGVFLKAGSFSSSGVSIGGGTIGSGGTVNLSDSTFVEGCERGVFVFERPTSSVIDSIFITTSGTATEGTDYNNITDLIILNVGETRDSIVIDAFSDGLTEPIETVILNIIYDGPCNSDTIQRILYLEDYEPMTATLTGDKVGCGDTVLLEPVITGGFGNYQYLWYPTQDTTDSIVASTFQTQVYYVTIEDDCGKSIQSQAVTLVKQCPIIIPNIITANGDGVNDVFFIQNITDYPENEVWFYDRWGVLLYYAYNYQNDWTPNVTEGVYYYVVDKKVGDPEKGFWTVFK